MILKFLVMLSLTTSILYLVTPTEQRTGVLLLACVVASLFLLFTGPSVEYMDSKPESTPKNSPTVSAASCIDYGKRSPVSGAIEVDVLPQVDSLGRNVDNKMALNHTASIIAAPGGVNAAFVENIASAENQGGLHPANDKFPGAPL
jgi:hypothetical protein